MFSSSSGACITITVPNVLLDLNGFVVQGPGGSSSTVGILIALRTATYASVINGGVTGFGTGIYARSRWGEYTNLNVTGNSANGLELNAPYARVSDNAITANGSYGVFMDFAYGSVVANNNIASNGVAGIWILAGGDYRIHANTLNGNGTAGLYVGCHPLSPGTLCVNPQHYPEHELTIVGNTALGNGYGIALDTTPTDNRIINNTAMNNSQFDMWDEQRGCSSNVWFANTFVNASSCIQ